jgi:hypothetical protein
MCVGGAVTKGRATSTTCMTPRVCAAVVGEVVRFRTFPSETSRRLMATMALAIDNPRASLKMRGGAVGRMDISPDFSDGSDTDLLHGVDEVDGKGRGHAERPDVSGTGLLGGLEEADERRGNEIGPTMESTWTMYRIGKCAEPGSSDNLYVLKIGGSFPSITSSSSAACVTLAATWVRGRFLLRRFFGETCMETSFAANFAAFSATVSMTS